MLTIAINIGYIAVTLAFAMTIWRLLVGPDMTDRLLALDTLYMNALAVLVLTGISWTASSGERSYHYEIGVLIALMGFVGTVAGARFIARGDAVE
ncbi:MAG: monovalent cation/H+ antiporter complex subunit F [Burkholderiaceae bacterium]